MAVVSGRRDVQGGCFLLLSSFLRVSSPAWLKGIGNGRYAGVGRRSGGGGRCQVTDPMVCINSFNMVLVFIAYSKIYILPF